MKNSYFFKILSFWFVACIVLQFSFDFFDVLHSKKPFKSQYIQELIFSAAAQFGTPELSLSPLITVSLRLFFRCFSTLSVHCVSPCLFFRCFSTLSVHCLSPSLCIFDLSFSDIPLSLSLPLARLSCFISYYL